MLEHNADGVFMLDATGLVRLWNRAAEAITLLEAPKRSWGGAQDDASPGGRRSPSACRWPAHLQGRNARRDIWSCRGASSARSSASLRGGHWVYAFIDLIEERVLEELRADFRPRAGTVPHELRTPLAAIYGAALTLQRE